VRTADPRRVGLFVLGALVLAVAAVTMVGGGRLWTERARYVAYFTESVKGLRRGAPVTFGGVPVGEVEGIRAELDPASGGLRVRVMFRVDPRALAVRDGGRVDLAALVARGLRAELRLESLLTGQLYLALRFAPGTPAPSVPDAPWPQIPTVPSTWTRLRGALEEAVVALPATVAELRATFAEIRALAAAVDRRRLDGMLARLAAAAAAVERAADALRPLLAQWRETGARAEALLARLDGEVAARGRDLERALTGVAGAARGVREMAAELRRTVAALRPGVEDFVTEGLPRLVGLVEDADRMILRLDSLLRDIRADPQRFLLGAPPGRTVPP